MRFFFAILSLLAAVVLLVLGVGQRTFLAGPKAIQEQLTLPASSENYLVIPAEVFEANPGNPSVVLTGEEPFLAYGHQRDVAGWVNTFEHLRVALKEADSDSDADSNADSPFEMNKVRAEQSQAETDEILLKPNGSDLWLSEYTGDTSLTVGIALEPNQAVLVTAGAEEATLPSDITIMWAQPRNTPLAGPFLVAGAAVGVLGIILYLLAIDHNRKGIGPRRGRRGPFQGLRNKRANLRANKERQVHAESRRGRRTNASIVAVALGTMLLTSCSPSYWPQPSTTPPAPVVEEVEEPQAVVPVLETQLDSIIERVASITNEADDTLNIELLESRLTDSALQQRVANYTIRKNEPEWRTLPHLTSERLEYDLVQSTEKWPRTLFVTVNSAVTLEAPEEDEIGEDAEDESGDPQAEIADQEFTEVSPTLALVLTQQTAHENYQLSRVIELRGGIEMPAAAPLSEGTAVLASDIQTLQLTPIDAANALADIMSSGEESEFYNDFLLIEEPLVEKMGSAWASSQCIDGLKCASDVKVSEDAIVTLSTGQSGALVLATITDNHSMTVENDRNVVKLSAVEKALGLDGAYKSVTRQWQHQVLMYVPGKDSEKKITILGSSSELVAASGVKN